MIAVPRGGSLDHSLLVRLDHGVHDRTVWIALALTAVIVVVVAVAVGGAAGIMPLIAAGSGGNRRAMFSGYRAGRVSVKRWIGLSAGGVEPYWLWIVCLSLPGSGLMAEFEVSVAIRDGCQVVTVCGDLDADTAPSLGFELDRLLGVGLPVIVDLSG